MKKKEKETLAIHYIERIPSLLDPLTLAILVRIAVNKK